MGRGWGRGETDRGRDRWTGEAEKEREEDREMEGDRQVQRWETGTERQETRCQGNRKGETVGRKEEQKYRGKQN